MKELLVPLPLQDVLSLMSSLKLGATVATDPDEVENFSQRIRHLQSQIDDMLGADTTYSNYLNTLSSLDTDLNTLEADLHRSEAQKDFGPGFVALARSFLDLRARRAELVREAALRLS